MSFELDEVNAKLLADSCRGLRSTGDTHDTLIQAAQHLARTHGPLGAFFRRLARRKGHSIAAVAAARKMATIAFLLLKHNEPYRYAPPLGTRGKLARFRIAATGERRRYAKPALG